MDPHPDFADVDLPRDFALEDLRLAPLAPDFLDEDFSAVVATEPLLGGLFGDWPAGLTREENLIDLAWHEREFTVRRSFSWILRDAEGTYIGCFYLFPALGKRGAATAALWLCDIPEREAKARRFKSLIGAWMAQAVPDGIKINWTSSPSL